MKRHEKVIHLFLLPLFLLAAQLALGESKIALQDIASDGGTGWLGGGLFLLTLGLGLYVIRLHYLLRRSSQATPQPPAQATTNTTLSDDELLLAKAVLDTIADAVITIDGEGLIQTFNPAAVLMFGYTLEEVRGKNVSVLLPEHERREHEAYTDKSTLHAPRIIFRRRELIGQRKDGSQFPLELNVAPLEAGSNRGYVGILRDITERRKAETALAESQQRLALHVSQTILAAIEWNTEFEVVEWNRGAEKVFGYSQEQAIGQHALGFVVPDNAREHVHAIWQSLLDGTGGQHSINECITKDGRTIICEWHNTRLVNDQGEVIGVASLAQDISERKQIEAELMLAKEEAERANQAKSIFLSSMSHELRTPLNSILGFAQLLESDPEHPLTESQHEDVQTINRAGKHLLGLINEILDLAKIESGQISLSTEPVSIPEVFEECGRFIESLRRQYHTTLDFHQPDFHPVVRADRVRLKQVLLNLISNAIKYNQKQGRVEVFCERAGENCLRICVRDNGIGISASQQKELFLPFHRLDAEDSHIEGTGIGLVITKNLVELMGGRIGFDSEKGKGSTFWFELPQDSLPEQVTVEDNGSEDTPAPQTSAHLTVLYIEDNPANLRVVQQILSRRKHINMLSTPDPVEGLELATTSVPDLILLDINLPGMSGYEVLVKLQADPITQHIPAIAISANAMPADIEHGLAAGFQDYITKPINIPEFLSAVDKVLAGKEAPQTP